MILGVSADPGRSEDVHHEAKGFAGLEMTHTLSESLPTIESPYQGVLRQVAIQWPSLDFPGKEKPGDEGSAGDTIKITCLSTPGRPFYVGIRQEMTIQASLSRVREVVDDFPNYVSLFEGLLKAERVSADGNRVLTEWEEHIGIPFVPNERNQVLYLVSDPNLRTRIYRYGLIRSNHMKTSDGLIVLEVASPTSTHYTEFDFVEPDLGAAKILGSDSVWKESVEGFLQTDLALKLASEHQDWLAKEVKRQSKILLKSYPIDEFVREKKPYQSPAH